MEPTSGFEIKKMLKKLFFPRDHRQDHFKALDGLRGIAVLLVMLSHASNRGLFDIGFFNFKYTGKFGVYLFFLLSAYLLDRQIALAIKNQKANIKYWLNYLLRRFLRIYPLFCLALIGNYLLLQYDIPYAIGIENMDILKRHLTLQLGREVFWSIPVEFIYYFISPVILVIVGYVTNWRINYIVIFILILIACCNLINPFLGLKNISTLKYLPIFLIGTLISMVEVFSDTFKELDKDERGVLDLFGIVAFVIIILMFHCIFSIFFEGGYPFHDQKYFVAISILWSVILLAAKYSKRYINTFLSFMPLRFLGVISFSAYLFHIPILKYLVEDEIIPHNLKIVVFIISTVILSIATFLLIERPLSKVKLRF